VADIAKAPGYAPTSYVSTVPVPNVSLATVQPGNEHAISGLAAGEQIQGGDLCYIKSDGKIWRSTGAAANAAAVVDGMAAENYSVGQSVTLWRGVALNYAAGTLVPGTNYYLSGTTVGGLADAASTGGTVVVARSLDTSKIFVKSSY
jgi:hypothetical protein